MGEQRVKFPKKRRILRPGEVISLAGFLAYCCSLGFSIRVNSHANTFEYVRCRIFVTSSIDLLVDSLCATSVICHLIVLKANEKQKSADGQFQSNLFYEQRVKRTRRITKK
ncbi:hypothetical protein SFRURICE_021438 [Spodoptera frugiperda]|nr:hypothetical protein SFRURICE_021438 [Spodoptera frugiperda]